MSSIVLHTFIIGTCTLLQHYNIATLYIVPSQPRDLTVNSHVENTTILNVAWAVPLCDNGVRTQYSVSQVLSTVYYV